jgi:hypothetical protein
LRSLGFEGLVKVASGTAFAVERVHEAVRPERMSACETEELHAELYARDKGFMALDSLHRVADAGLTLAHLALGRIAHDLELLLVFDRDVVLPD